METLLSAIKAYVSKAVYGTAKQTSVDAAARTAERAEGKADSAQATADYAKSTADGAVQRESCLTTTTRTFTWDPIKDGYTDSFKISNYLYCKVSDKVIAYEDVKSVKLSGGNDSSGTEREVRKGDGCFVVITAMPNGAIVVERAGLCNDDVSVMAPNEFVAPSPGIYFYKGDTTAKGYTKSLEVTYDEYAFDVNAHDIASIRPNVPKVDTELILTLSSGSSSAGTSLDSSITHRYTTGDFLTNVFSSDVGVGGIFTVNILATSSQGGHAIEKVDVGNPVTYGNGTYTYGNASLKSAEAEDTGESYCVTITKNNGRFTRVDTYVRNADYWHTSYGISVSAYRGVATEVPEACIPSTVARSADLTSLATRVDALEARVAALEAASAS